MAGTKTELLVEQVLNAQLDNNRQISRVSDQIDRVSQQMQAVLNFEQHDAEDLEIEVTKGVKKQLLAAGAAVDDLAEFTAISLPEGGGKDLMECDGLLAVTHNGVMSLVHISVKHHITVRLITKSAKKLAKFRQFMHGLRDGLPPGKSKYAAQCRALQLYASYKIVGVIGGPNMHGKRLIKSAVQRGLVPYELSGDSYCFVPDATTPDFDALLKAE